MSSGIAGYLGAEQKPAILNAMLHKMAHRGGSEQVYAAETVFVGIRADAAAASLARSENSGVAVLFSGHLANRRELREKLYRQGVVLKTENDAEAVLHLYRLHGVGTDHHLRGAFTFAIHDKVRGLVLLARDPLGAKPLYYATTPSGDFVFASELRAVLEHPGVRVIPDMRGIDAYLTMGFSPAAAGMFKGVHKLPPGHRLVWNPGLHVMVEPHWEWKNHIKPDAALKSDADVQARFDALFEDAVAAQATHECRPCVFLSGRAEDSAIAAALMRQGFSALPTLEAGVPAAAEEKTQGAVVAERLGTSHRFLPCLSADMEKLPEIVWAMGEPVADPAVVSLYLAAKAARAQGTAALSGVGADGLLLGDPTQDMFARLNTPPRFLLPVLRAAARKAPLSWLRLFAGCYKMEERSRLKLVDLLGAFYDRDGVRQRLLLAAVFDARDKEGFLEDAQASVAENFADGLRDWPPVEDHLLARVEQVAALHGVGTRLPFADRALAEFLLSVPGHLKYRKGRGGKILLQNYLARVLPGLPAASPVFAPIDLSSGPLKEMTGACLSEASVRKRGLFNTDAVRHILSQVKDGDYLYSRQAFALLTLELWFRIYIDKERGWVG